MSRACTPGMQAPGRGTETHFRIKIVAEAFAGRSRLDRHRTVNGILADELVGGGACPGDRGASAKRMNVWRTNWDRSS